MNQTERWFNCFTSRTWETFSSRKSLRTWPHWFTNKTSAILWFQLTQRTSTYWWRKSTTLMMVGSLMFYWSQISEHQNLWQNSTIAHKRWVGTISAIWVSRRFYPLRGSSCILSWGRRIRHRYGNLMLKFWAILCWSGIWVGGTRWMLRLEIRSIFMRPIISSSMNSQELLIGTITQPNHSRILKLTLWFPRQKWSLPNSTMSWSFTLTWTK